MQREENERANYNKSRYLETQPDYYPEPDGLASLSIACRTPQYPTHHAHGSAMTAHPNSLPLCPSLLPLVSPSSQSSSFAWDEDTLVLDACCSPRCCRCSPEACETDEQDGSKNCTQNE